jgi:hypothetical protein
VDVRSCKSDSIRLSCYLWRNWHFPDGRLMLTRHKQGEALY